MKQAYTSIKAARDRATLAFVAMCIVTLLAIGLNIHEIRTLNAIRAGEGGGTPIQRLANMEERENLMKWLYRATFVGTAIGFLTWLYTASANLAALGVRNQKFGKWEAVGWWFCPVICLYQPYQVMKEVWTGSDPHTTNEEETDPHNRSVSKLITPWWATWLLGTWGYIIFQFIPREQSRTISGAMDIVNRLNTIEATLLGCSLVALMLATLILRQISDNQEEKHSAPIEQGSEEDTGMEQVAG